MIYLFIWVGLLILDYSKTTNGRWFICEYGTEANKNQVCLLKTTVLKILVALLLIKKENGINKFVVLKLKVKASINSIKKKQWKIKNV